MCLIQINADQSSRLPRYSIAQMMRVGLFKPVHVKAPASQQRRLLLTSRKLLQRNAYDMRHCFIKLGRSV